MMRYLSGLLFCLFIFVSQAHADLVIHAAEIGIGKFHRYDNSVHPYGSANAWTPYILPAGEDEQTPIVVENADHSITIFFSTLEELLKKVTEVSQQRKEKVGVFNLNAHGLPGGMWFPMNESFKNSFECWQWKAAATGTDKANYDQYYSPVSKEDVLNIREMSEAGGAVPCVTGLSQWKSVLKSQPEVKQAFTKQLKVNLLSCVVGLGPVGDKFMAGIAELLSTGTESQFRSTLNFGLGDWSMPEGMGFWDYHTDEQLQHDNSIYGVNRKDREIMKKGQIRVTALVKGTWQSTVVENQEFMTLERDGLDLSQAVWGRENMTRWGKRPQRVRIPGTNVYENVF